VSAANVVATIETPINHQGALRPDAKNSDKFLPDRLPKNNAGKKQIANDKIKTTQSNGIIVNEENKYNLKSP
jgi:hypothetical protein